MKASDIRQGDTIAYEFLPGLRCTENVRVVSRYEYDEQTFVIDPECETLRFHNDDDVELIGRIEETMWGWTYSTEDGIVASASDEHLSELHSLREQFEEGNSEF